MLHSWQATKDNATLPMYFFGDWNRITSVGEGLLKIITEQNY